MNESLDRQIARLRTRLARTPLPAFFAWWGQNLLACLPPRLSAIIADRSDNLLVQVQGEELLVWREHGDGRTNEYGRVALNLAPDAQIAAFERLRHALDDPASRTIYCMPADRVLQRDLHLPAAAADNLRQVLSFEMDRQTPFKADQVYFDARVLGVDASGRHVDVDMVVIPRAQLDAELAKAAGGNLPLNAVDSWKAAPGEDRRHANLLPVERRAQRGGMRLPIQLGLAALAIILVGVNMAESLSNRASAAQAMQAEVEQAKAEARKVAEQKKQLGDLINGANFLTDKKRTSALMIGLLDDITRRLPDSAYLERLSENDGQVQLQGEADNAASLIGLLVESRYLANPGFQGQIQPDPRTGKDRFTINSELRKDVPLAADAEPSAAQPDAPLPAADDGAAAAAPASTPATDAASVDSEEGKSAAAAKPKSEVDKSKGEAEAQADKKSTPAEPANANSEKKKPDNKKPESKKPGQPEAATKKPESKNPLAPAELSSDAGALSPESSHAH